jgi:hypothetical protein
MRRGRIDTGTQLSSGITQSNFRSFARKNSTPPGPTGTGVLAAKDFHSIGTGATVTRVTIVIVPNKRWIAFMVKASTL